MNVDLKKTVPIIQVTGLNADLHIQNLCIKKKFRNFFQVWYYDIFNSLLIKEIFLIPKIPEQVWKTNF